MPSPTLAGPPGDCCFTSGVKHFGTPSGRTVTIADVPTYVSHPQSQTEGNIKKIILYLPDVFGPFSINCQLLQDYYASHGFVVLGIDYFLGDPVHVHNGEPNFDRQAWTDKSRKQASDVFPKWLEAVKKIYGTDAKYCTVGYCFGGPYVLDLAATDDVVAAAFAHPAFLDEDHFEKAKQPLLLSCSETDYTFSVESRRRAEDILVKNKATYTIQVFSGVEHGFAVRGDPNVGDSRWAKEESARGIIGWFLRFAA